LSKQEYIIKKIIYIERYKQKTTTLKLISTMLLGSESKNIKDATFRHYTYLIPIIHIIIYVCMIIYILLSNNIADTCNLEWTI